MPANPYKEERRCAERLKRIISNIPETGIDRDLLVWEIKTQFAVSKRYIKDFLDDHIKAGLIQEKEGVIHGT